MVLAVGLFVLLAAMTFWFYNSSLATREKGIEVSRNVQLARVVLDRIANEVRQAAAFVPSYGPGVFGYKDRIEINTLALPDKKLSEKRAITDAPLPGQFDLQQVRYYIAWDEDNLDEDGNPRALGLVRRVSKTYMRDVVFLNENENSQATDESQMAFKEELYAPEIKYIEFLYYDGATWWDKWELSQRNSLPQMIRITIGFVPEIPDEQDVKLIDDNFLRDESEREPLAADRYTMLVRSPQADIFFGSRITREASALSESANGM